MTQVLLDDLLRKAFVAGFMASGQCYNGSYPFDFDHNRIERELAEEFRVFRDNLTIDVTEDQCCRAGVA